ncbi:ABC transporter permease [Microbacterium gorillae]|uniref:ABC transporter permease n=1 Tax=Microbacterium gorillae TaxID=1231063 RepID=UPI00058F25B8|nr:ABC transporter permease [Microbacterium gorillae]
MTAAQTTVSAPPPEGAVVRAPLKLKVPIALTVVLVLLGLLLTLAPRSGTAVYALDPTKKAQRIDITLGDLPVPADATIAVVMVILVLITAWCWFAALTRRSAGTWAPTVFAVLAVFAFITWAAAGASGRVPVVGLLGGALSLAVPLVFGALGGIIGERVGVVNVAIEAQFLLGAFSAAIASTITKNPYVGLIGAMIGGVLVAFVLAAFAIKYLVEQVIIGVVLNVLVLGLTSFLYQIVLVPNTAALNSPVSFESIKIPLLGDIPIIGPILFNQPFIVYLMYIVVPLVAFSLYRTRWGLRVRAVGEYPKAADTVGIKVNPTRFWNVLLAGALAGIGGAYFTLASVPTFTQNMTNGLGFIALAAVIFGRWDPVRATFAALLFGFAQNLQNTFTALSSPVPKEFLLMLPYIVTLIAVAGFVGRIQGPAASGKPYIKS